MLNKVLTDKFKSIIVKEDLIDTGALLRSIRVFDDIKYDKVQINITSKNYVKYLKDRYHLIRQFINSPEFINESGLLLYPLLEAQVINALNGIPVGNFNPEIIVLVNGK